MPGDYTWVFDPDRSDGGIIVDRAGQTAREAIEYHEIRIGGQMQIVLETWPVESKLLLRGTLGGHPDTGMTLGGLAGGVHSGYDSKTLGGPYGGTLGGEESTGMALGSIPGSTSNGDTAGALGTTLGTDADKKDHIYRYKELRKYGRYAGQYDTKELLDGTNSITDRTPVGADVDSVIVALVPGDGWQSLPGLWVGIDSYQDNTDIIENGTAIQMQVTVLDLVSNHATRTDLLNAH